MAKEFREQKPEEEPEVLHTDYEGYKVRLHKDENGKKFVTYDRYPQDIVQFDYLEPHQIGERLINGDEFTNEYIPKVSFDMLKNKLSKIYREKKQYSETLKTLEDDPNSEQRDIDREKRFIATCLNDIDEIHNKVNNRLLDKNLMFKGCIIENFDLSRSSVKSISFENNYYELTEEISSNRYVRPEAKMICNHIFGNLSLDYSVIDGDLDCNYVYFNENIFLNHNKVRNSHKWHHNRTKVKGNVTFNNCYVYKWLYLQDLIIEGDLKFTDCKILGLALMNYLVVLNDAKFDNSIFVELQLSAAKFNGLCNFGDNKICKLALANTVFKENLSLYNDEEFSNEEIFELLTFIRQVVTNEYNLSHTNEKGEWIDIYSDLEKLLLSNRYFGTIDFSSTILLGYFDCKSELILCHKNPILLIHKHAVDPINVENDDDIENLKCKLFQKSKEQYAWLEEQYRKNGDYISQDEAHKFSSECDRLATEKTYRKCLIPVPLMIIIISAIALFLSFFSEPREFINNMVFPLVFIYLILFCVAFPTIEKFWINKMIFGYGVSKLNIPVTILIVIVFCSFFFGFADYVTTKTNHLIMYGDNGIRPFDFPYLNGLYFSVITFATVGFGDVSATGWAAGLAMVEGLLGVILNAALIVVLFRKLVR